MVPKEEYILFSGAANGAEAEFGACAEKYGVEEVNFTFEGHKVARTRGLRHLTGEELRRVPDPVLEGELGQGSPTPPRA